MAHSRRGPADPTPKDAAERPATAATIVTQSVVAGPQAPDDLRRGTLVERYLVLDRLGTGGMGVVYAAYDPDLDRRVALKLLRPSGAAAEDSGHGRARLLREAQALARLSHPNVIVVYDVGVYQDHVFVAVELVAGDTLARWLRASPRTWREVRAVFLQAGHGLAAAHAAGLVHRDFKPANVLVGADGSVKVLDFGLARAAASPAERGTTPADAVPPSGLLEGELTGAGALLGTPGYIAPEQLDGAPLDARSDQFSFCVALHEALHGTPPFAGRTAEELARNAAAGRVQAPAHEAAIPGWLQQVVRRGLQPAPAARFPSMTALLAALAHERGSRRRWLAAGVAALGLAATTVWMSGGGSAPPMCRGAEEQLAGVWNADRRRAVEAAFAATGVSYAGAAFHGAASALDTYATSWTGMRRDACEATRVRGEQSEELLDLRMSCLDRALAGLDATAAVLAVADAAVVEHAVDAARSLPELRRCADTEGLRAPVRLPAEAAARARIEALYAEVAVARALAGAGKFAEALPRARGAAEQAQAAGYRPLEAQALHQLGSLLRHLGDDAAAEAAMVRGAAAAVAGHDDAAAADLWIDLVSTATSMGAYGRARQWGELAAGALERAGAAAWLRADLTQALGRNLYAEGSYDEAAAAMKQALAEHERLLGPVHSQVALDLWNLGAIYSDQGRYAEAEEVLARGVRVLEQLHGPDHPALGRPLSSLGYVLETVGRHAEAQVALERAVAVQERALGAVNPDLASTMTNLAGVYESTGRRGEAIATLRRALAIKEQALGREHPSVAITLGNLGDMLREDGALDEALPVLERALAIKERALGGEHPSLAYPLTSLGYLHLAAGRPAQARPLLERALALRSANQVHPNDLAHTRFGLARALWEAGHERARARDLAASAHRAYAAAGDEGAADRDRIASWLAERR